MSKFFRLCLSFGFALLFAVPASAATCGIDRYTTNTYKGLCIFSQFFGTIKVSIPFIPPPQLLMPNLVPHGMHYFVTGSVVDVAVEVDNDSLRVAAGAHDVHVVITVMQQGVAVDTFPLMIRSTGVAAAGSTTTYMGQITIRDRNYDNDLLAAISVDSPTAAAPSGSVREANEMDNTTTKNCRIYGSINPDFSVRPCN